MLKIRAKLWGGTNWQGNQKYELLERKKNLVTDFKKIMQIIVIVKKGE